MDKIELPDRDETLGASKKTPEEFMLGLMEAPLVSPTTVAFPRCYNGRGVHGRWLEHRHG